MVFQWWFERKMPYKSLKRDNKSNFTAFVCACTWIAHQSIQMFACVGLCVYNRYILSCMSRLHLVHINRASYTWVFNSRAYQPIIKKLCLAQQNTLWFGHFEADLNFINILLNAWSECIWVDKKTKISIKRKFHWDWFFVGFYTN